MPAAFSECVQRAAAYVAARARGDLDGAEAMVASFDNDNQRALAFAALAELAVGCWPPTTTSPPTWSPPSSPSRSPVCRISTRSTGAASSCWPASRGPTRVAVAHGIRRGSPGDGAGGRGATSRWARRGCRRAGTPPTPAARSGRGVNPRSTSLPHTPAPQPKHTRTFHMRQALLTPGHLDVRQASGARRRAGPR